MKQRIDVSIIVPVYNVEDFLVECLDTLYAIKNIMKQVILIDDGSTDKSLEIVQDYKQRYPQETKVIEQKNGGVSKARNAGIVGAEGEFCAFIDSDDTINVEAFTALVEQGKRENLDVVSGRAQRFNSQGTHVMSVPAMLFDLPPLSGHEYLKTYYDNASVCAQDFRPEACFSLYRTELVLSNKLFFAEGINHEDELFTPTALLSASRVKVYDILFYNYREREGSITSVQTPDHLKSKARLVLALVDMLRKEKFSHEFLNSRIVGWCRESKSYLGCRQLCKVAALRKLGIKDWMLLGMLMGRSLLSRKKS